MVLQKRQSGTEMEPVIDFDSVQDEWVIFKQLMDSNFRPCTYFTSYMYDEEIESVRNYSGTVSKLVDPNHPQPNNACKH